MDEATAFAPGHLSGFSGVHRADDPTAAGARGGGIVVADGVRVTVRSTDEGEFAVESDGGPVEFGAASRVLRALRVPGARVEVETSLVPGAGLGATGAVALGTALAANAAFDRALSESELVTVAHGAEVQAGTGLVNIVPIGILAFFSLLFLAFNYWGWDPFTILITHFLTLFPLAVLIVVTYVAGRVIQRDEGPSA